MNGFTNIVNGFSQAAIDALKTQADALYITEEWTEIEVNTSQLTAYDMSSLTSATKFLVSNGTVSFTFNVGGNTVPVWIEAVNQNGVTFTNEVNLNSDDITLSNVKFTGDNAQFGVSADDCRITKCTFDEAGVPYWVRCTTAHRLEIDHNTFQNQRDGVSEVAIALWSYGDDVVPAAYHVHHNYFVDMLPSTCIQPRLRATSTNDVGLGEDFGNLPGWDFGRNEWKDDETIIEHNYFLRAEKPMNGKMNNLIFRNNTTEDCPRRSNFRAGKGSIAHDNYFLNSNGFDVADKNHTVYNNYHLGSDSLGAIQISNGGYGGNLLNYKEAATDVNCYNNYLDTMDRGYYFGLKIDSEGFDDQYPSGVTINSFGKDVVGFIHVNSATSPMGNMTTTPNDTDTATSWDMSGVYDATDVANGTVGAGV